VNGLKRPAPFRTVTAEFGNVALSMSTTARAGARVLPPTISKVGTVTLA